MLAIFIKRRRPDALEFAFWISRLETVRSFGAG
jgi:hypothetical protein